MSVLPKYAQVKMDIIRKIESGYYKNHQLMPPESQLQRDYNVSRITIRRALEELRYEGMIYKVQGRGTYIGTTAESGINFSDRSNSCYNEIKKHGYTAEKKLLALKPLICDQETADKYGLIPGEKYLLYERTYSGDGKPIAYERSYYVYRYVAGIEHKDFASESFGKTLQEQYFYSLRLTRESVLKAIGCPKEIAEILKIDCGQPIIAVQATTHKIEPSGIRGICIEKTFNYWITEMLPICLLE